MHARLSCARCNLGNVWTDEPSGLLRELCRRKDCAAERQAEAAERQRKARSAGSAGIDQQSAA